MEGAVEKQVDLKMLDAKIRDLRKTAEDIKELGGTIEAVKRNINRVLASTKMLELNVSDVQDFQ
jgi:hypothetical protein